MDSEVNRFERTAYKDVRAVAAAHGASVHLYTKLSGVADPRDAGASFDWATRAELDLLVRDDERFEPLFAIEVDGKQHADPKQAKRDRLKDHLLERAGIDIIRVTTGTVTWRHGRDRLSAYLANLWFCSRTFHSMQERGELPGDEPFVHFLMLDPDPHTGRHETLDPSMRLRVRLMHDWYRGGPPIEPFPACWFRHRDDVGLIEAKVLIALDEEHFLFAESRIGRARIAAVVPSDIAEEVALLECELMYRRWRAGEPEARHIRDLADLLPDVSTKRGRVSEQRDGWFSTGTTSRMVCWLSNAPGPDRAAAIYGPMP